jgi:hypothetical protein
VTAPSDQVIPARRGKKDFTRRGSDLATLAEVAAIVNEGNRRQKEYFDQCFNSFVQEYEEREAQKKFGGKIRRKVRELFAKKPPEVRELSPES